MSVVIPTRNEASAISRVLADLPADLVTEIIVVDSNSTGRYSRDRGEDGSMRCSRTSPRIRACVSHRNRAAANAPDVVVFLDGDYSDRPSELPIVLAPIIEGSADITVGSRLRKQRIAGALPWHQAFGNRLAASLIRILYRCEHHLTSAPSALPAPTSSTISRSKRPPTAGQLK